jgi:hypothetical protein
MQTISGLMFRVDEIDRFFYDVSNSYGTSLDRLVLLSVQSTTVAGALSATLPRSRLLSSVTAMPHGAMHSRLFGLGFSCTGRACADYFDLWAEQSGPQLSQTVRRQIQTQAPADRSNLIGVDLSMRANRVDMRVFAQDPSKVHFPTFDVY